ncbi:hypothetical protein BH23ACI1_BH23ACI1_29080 [soil metagenome]
MDVTTAQVVLWAPRLAGILLAAFLAVFALDGAHLAPALMVLAIVAVAWRAEWFGAAAFLAVALGYALMVNWRLDWMAVISGPLVVVSVLFLASWRQRLAAGARN